MTLRALAWTLAQLVFCGLAVAATPPTRRVVVVVCDGLRRDFVTAENTPNLQALADRGVWFAHHHPVYISATEVNGVAIATGAYPANSGVMANEEYRPAIDIQKAIGIGAPASIRRGDELSGGHYLERATVAEILRAHGLPTVIAGSKRVARLHDRAERDDVTHPSPVVYEGRTLPSQLGAELAALHGPFPAPAPHDDKTARDDWTTRVLLESLWKHDIPPFSLLWLAEPDSSQHETGVGSAQTLKAIANSDRDFGLVVRELERRGQLDTTDIVVLSDHGFSNIGRKVDVAAELRHAGFAATRMAPKGLKRGQVLSQPHGGSTSLYVGEHDRDACNRIAEYLQLQNWTGVIFSREPIAGTFPLHEARIDSKEAPDFVVSLRWPGVAGAAAIAGLQTSDMAPDGKKAANHASVARPDMSNVLIAAGPDFRSGVVGTLPTGNVDIAPTVLWCLGFRAEARQMDGRVLTEALTIDGPPLQSYATDRLVAHRTLPQGEWRQYLSVCEVDGVRYIDEGNGGFVPASRQEGGVADPGAASATNQPPTATPPAATGMTAPSGP